MIVMTLQLTHGKVCLEANPARLFGLVRHSLILLATITKELLVRRRYVLHAIAVLMKAGATLVTVDYRIAGLAFCRAIETDFALGVDHRS